MLETSSLEKGYVYGPIDEVKERIAGFTNAYPQGWHLATAHTANGFGINFFNPSQPILVLNSYFIILFLWFSVSVYCFVRAGWSIIGRYIKKQTPGAMAVYTIIGTLLGLTVYWGSLVLGFINFLGCLAYYSLAVTIVEQAILKPKAHTRELVGLMSLCAMAVSQIWLLPAPAIWATTLLTAHHLFRSSFNWRDKKKLLLPLIPVTVCLGFSIFQIIVLVLFSAVSSEDQLNTYGDAFWISNILFGVTSLWAIAYWSKYKKSALALIFSTAPIVAFYGAILIYQLFKVDKAGYYAIKMSGVALSVIGIYAITATVIWLVNSRYEAGRLIPGLLLSTAIVSCIIVSTGQNIESFDKLFQRNSKIEYQTAAAMERYFNEHNNISSNLIVLREKSYDEDHTATFLSNRIAHVYNRCYGVSMYPDQTTIQQVSTLDLCAANGRSITVITSDKTLAAVKQLNRSNIDIVNVP